jgi:hypothetical protein
MKKIKTPTISITFTLEELRELGFIIHNGWGCGDITDGLSSSSVRTMKKAMQKVLNAQQKLANEQ